MGELSLDRMGGGGKTAIGSITVTAGNNFTVDLGFFPKFLFAGFAAQMQTSYAQQALISVLDGPGEAGQLYDNFSDPQKFSIYKTDTGFSGTQQQIAKDHTIYYFAIG